MLDSLRLPLLSTLTHTVVCLGFVPCTWHSANCDLFLNPWYTFNQQIKLYMENFDILMKTVMWRSLLFQGRECGSSIHRTPGCFATSYRMDAEATRKDVLALNWDKECSFFLGVLDKVAVVLEESKYSIDLGCFIAQCFLCSSVFQTGFFLIST